MKWQLRIFSSSGERVEDDLRYAFILWPAAGERHEEQNRA
jgi:hypothetical protein